MPSLTEFRGILNRRSSVAPPTIKATQRLEAERGRLAGGALWIDFFPAPLQRIHDLKALLHRDSRPSSYVVRARIRSLKQGGTYYYWEFKGRYKEFFFAKTTRRRTWTSRRYFKNIKNSVDKKSLTEVPRSEEGSMVCSNWGSAAI